MQAIAYNCSQLQTLNLGWCEGVSDNGVTSLASGCPDLRALDLCGCVLITGIQMPGACVVWNSNKKFLTASNHVFYVLNYGVSWFL